MEPDSERGVEKQGTEISQGTKIIIVVSAFILVFSIIVIYFWVLLFNVSVEISPGLLSLILNGQVPSVR